MNGRRYQFSRVPPAIRRAKLDNLAIVPASLLPFKAKWQEMANSLPNGDVLIIMPTSETPQKATLRRVAALFQSKGHSVTTISAERFG